jgi:hypothetical protein
MSVTQRLEQYLKLKNISLNSFDKRLGLGNGYIGKQIKKNASIGSEILQKIIAQFPDLNPLWLLLGKGNMVVEDENKPPNQYSTTPSTLDLIDGSGADDMEKKDMYRRLAINLQKENELLREELAIRNDLQKNRNQ